MDLNTLRLPDVPADIPHGDMPGDRICITEDHIKKAGIIFPRLLEKLSALPDRRKVIAVCGGSGVGKSEIASVLAYYFNSAGTGAYVLSGDNYPRRIPRDNDLERLRVYREGGLAGLREHDLISPEMNRKLKALWSEERDADPASASEDPRMAVYQRAGREALTEYLGTPAEIDFAQLSDILARFRQGCDEICLRRMGRVPEELWYDKVGFSAVQVLIVEWTHGNSDFLEGIDIPVLLNSTPAETLAHRRARNRDGRTDSAFTTLVLEIEQMKLEAQARKAGIIVSKQGELLSYADYRRLMAEA